MLPLFVTLAALVLAPLQGHAAEPDHPWSDDHLAATSSAIVTGRVADITSGRDLDTGAAHRYVTIAVDATVKGRIGEREIVLKQASVDNQATFAVGEAVLLFLTTNADGTLSTAGLWQGKWVLDVAGGERHAVRFDPHAAARGILRGVGERRALAQLVDRARASAGNGGASDRAFVAQPSAEEMRGAAHESPLATTVPVAASPRGTTVGNVAPSAPFDLRSSVVGSTVTLSWQPPLGPVTTYIIQAGSSPGLSNLANAPTGNAATSFSAAGVGPGVYYVRVRAANADGGSAPSNEVVVTVGGGCFIATPPENLRLVSTTGGTVVLQWDESPLAYTYVIEAGSAPGLANLVNSDLGSNLPGLRATGVAAGLYYVRVRAKNPCGVSAPSNEVLVPVGTGVGSLTISFDPDPAYVAPPFYCSGLWQGPQWATDVVVTNTGTTGVTVTGFTSTAPGTLNPRYNGNGNNFAVGFLPCDDPNAFFGSPRVEPGDRRCLFYCPVARETSASIVWEIRGADDGGRAVSDTKTLRLPSWSAATASVTPQTTSRPDPSPTAFVSLKPAAAR
jgi:hypothetical protein